MVLCDDDDRVVEAREATFLRRRSVLVISLQRTVSCARQPTPTKPQVVCRSRMTYLTGHDTMYAVSDPRVG